MQLNRRKAFTAGKYAELQTIVREMGIADQSLQKLFANFFRKKISKSQQLSNWETDVLTESQKIYAATDAWACVKLYEEIQRLESTGYMLDIIPDPNAISPQQLEAQDLPKSSNSMKDAKKVKRTNTSRKRIKQAI
jgi:hypothetical protein